MASVVLAEFADPHALVEATRRFTEAGHKGLDTYTPYPVKGLSEAMRLRRSPVPKIVLIAALTGGTLAYLMQSWMAAVDYPINVGGRPLNAIPAWVPIMFELSVLFGAFGALLGMLGLSRLPELFYPAQRLEAFRTATVSGFWLSVPVEREQVSVVERRARDLGAKTVSLLRGEEEEEP